MQVPGTKCDCGFFHVTGIRDPCDKDCSDGIDCTVDSLTVVGNEGVCSHTAVDAACDDGLWCNGAETCSATEDCQAGTAPVCDDSVDCTDDSCDEATDSA